MLPWRPGVVGTLNGMLYSQKTIVSPKLVVVVFNLEFRCPFEKITDICPAWHFHIQGSFLGMKVSKNQRWFQNYFFDFLIGVWNPVQGKTLHI